ncbi:MAG: phenylalanine--tRNA ligase subunit beta [Nanoarchaeota archaeon]
MTALSLKINQIEKEIGVLDENMKNKIIMMGVEIDSATSDAITFNITPNRPDLLSLQGFIRTTKAFIGKEKGIKKYSVHNPEKDYIVKISPSVKDVRPYTACAIVKNLSLDNEKIKEIIDLQEKLHSTIGRNRKKLAIGIYPLEKISLPIKYTARNPKDIRFIPLESEKEMSAPEILRNHPTGKEYAHLLDKNSLFPVFIDSKDKILSMPPIINSQETGKISLETKDVFIECSGFDFSILQKTLNIVVTSLADMGGAIYGMTLEDSSKSITPDLSTQKMKISLENTNKLLGLNLKDKDLEKLLPKMGFEYKSGKVIIPAWRTDIMHEVDIIEDIAIAYGYNQFTPEIPSISTVAEESYESRLKSKIAEILIGLQFIEVSSYHLIKGEEIKKFKSQPKIEIENSKTEYKFLRPNLLIPALRIFSENKDSEYPQKIFELGPVFAKNNESETGIEESSHLLMASSPGNSTYMKQILDYLAKMLFLKCNIAELSIQGLIEGRTYSIMINNKPIGYFGEVHPETLRDWNIKMPLSVLEIALEEIILILKEKS